MGKKSKKEKATASAMADDELLDQAAAENKALREQELAEGCPTKAELLEALDSVTLFDLRVVDNGKGTQTCLSPAGDYVFYVDVSDASEAMQARQVTHAGHLALGTTGLGRAFGLTEGSAFGFQTNAKFPMSIQGSTAVINDLVSEGLDAGAKSLCPKDLRNQLNQRTTAIPMFSLDELINGTETAPYFFSKVDMVEHWMSTTGKTQEQLPSRLVMTDLRVLIMRMMTVPSDFRTIKLIPNKSTIELLKGASANNKAKAEEASATIEASAADEPPPLEAN